MEYTCCAVQQCNIESQQTFSTLVKAEHRQKPPLWLEAAVCFCDQVLKEPYYRFGLTWTTAQPHIPALPTELSGRVLETHHSAFQMLLICSLRTFSARHCIFILTQNTRFASRSYWCQNWTWTCISRADSGRFLDVTGCLDVNFYRGCEWFWALSAYLD